MKTTKKKGVRIICYGNRPKII